MHTSRLNIWPSAQLRADRQHAAAGTQRFGGGEVAAVVTAAELLQTHNRLVCRAALAPAFERTAAPCLRGEQIIQQ